MTRDVRPKCMIRGCRNRATRWDGGIFSVDLKDGIYTPNPIVWLCTEHDPHHKHFDLPQTLPSAIRDLKALRETFQAYVKKTYSADHSVDQQKMRAIAETLLKLVDSAKRQLPDADGVDWETINEAEALAEALCPSLFHQGDGQLPRSK